MSEIAHGDTSAPHPDGRDGTRGAERAIRVMAVDDDPMVLDLIRVMLKAAPGIELVATAVDGDEVIGVVTAHHPDVVLMDVRMQRVGGIDATRALTKRPDAPRVVILTTFDEQDYGLFTNEGVARV